MRKLASVLIYVLIFVAILVIWNFLLSHYFFSFRNRVSNDPIQQEPKPNPKPKLVLDDIFLQRERYYTSVPPIVEKIAKNITFYSSQTKIVSDFDAVVDESLFIFNKAISIIGAITKTKQYSEVLNQMLVCFKIFIKISCIFLCPEREIVLIALHENESSFLSSPFRGNFLRTPFSMNLWCVFSDGSYSLLRVFEWISYTEFVHVLKCRFNPKLEQIFLSNGSISMLLVNARKYPRNETFSVHNNFSQPVTIFNDSILQSEAILGHFIFNNLEYVVRRPKKLALCSSPLYNKGKYLQEWIEYHLLIGVEHIFLYNAGWSDDTDAVLAPYIEEGLVSVTKWYKPGFSDHRRSGQLASSNHCLYHNKDFVEWLLYLDVDEFIYPLNDDNVTVLLKDFDHKVVSSIEVCGMLFGGIPNPNTSLVVEKFTLRALKCAPRRWRSKFFARTQYTSAVAVHWVVGINDVLLPSQLIRVNHYFAAHRLRPPPDNEMISIPDTSLIDRFLPRLKQQIEKRQQKLQFTPINKR